MKKPINTIKSTIFGLSFFYLGVYLPFALMTYFPQWYNLNCKLHPRCQYVGYSNAYKYIIELTDYFKHRGDLTPGWTEKERVHLSEVRKIFDGFSISALILLMLFIITFKKPLLRLFSLVNMGIALAFSLLMVFFKPFWVGVLHPLFFKNNFWLNTPFDRSFYIMPGIFFKYSMALLIGFLFLLNCLTWLISRKQKCGPIP
jgi:hypothetical protein